MAQDQTDRSDRRAFLQAGALATASALSAAPGYGAQDAPAKATTLPKRKLGKTGLEITMLEMGTGALREQGVLERLIRLSYASGVRTFDTAKAYGTEPGFKKWFERTPEVRKEIVLVTKDNPREPKEMLGDARQAAGGPVDRLCRLVLHPRPGRRPQRSTMPSTSSSRRNSRRRPTRSASRAKPNSSVSRRHHKDRAAIIQAAAEGGIIDAIMLQYTPWLDKDEPLNKALDACYKKGIGLISMKQVAGQFPAHAKKHILDEVVKRVPDAGGEEAEPVPGPACTRSGPTSGSAVHACRSRRPISFVKTPTPPGGMQPLTTARDPPASRCRPGVRPDPVRRLRRPVLDRRRHQCRAGQPDPVPHLPRAPRHPQRSPPPVCRAVSRGPRLDRRRPRSRPGRLPQQAGFRQAVARVRQASRLSSPVTDCRRAARRISRRGRSR